MLSSMPGKGLGTAAKRIGEAAAKPAKAQNPKMQLLKRKLAPMKKQKSMPMQKAKSSVPAKGETPYPKMQLLKRKLAPMKKQKSMPMQKAKSMPMLPKAEKATPSFMKPGYQPGSIMRGYTQYA